MSDFLLVFVVTQLHEIADASMNSLASQQVLEEQSCLR